MSVETNPHNYTNMNNIFSQFAAVKNSAKKEIPKPARIFPQTPFLPAPPERFGILSETPQAFKNPTKKLIMLRFRTN